jgi:hypothetical protein
VFIPGASENLFVLGRLQGVVEDLHRIMATRPLRTGSCARLCDNELSARDFTRPPAAAQAMRAHAAVVEYRDCCRQTAMLPFDQAHGAACDTVDIGDCRARSPLRCAASRALWRSPRFGILCQQDGDPTLREAGNRQIVEAAVRRDPNYVVASVTQSRGKPFIETFIRRESLALRYLGDRRSVEGASRRRDINHASASVTMCSGGRCHPGNLRPRIGRAEKVWRAAGWEGLVGWLDGPSGVDTRGRKRGGDQPRQGISGDFPVPAEFRQGLRSHTRSRFASPSPPHITLCDQPLFGPWSDSSARIDVKTDPNLHHLDPPPPALGIPFSVHHWHVRSLGAWPRAWANVASYGLGNLGFQERSALLPNLPPCTREARAADSFPFTIRLNR